VSREPALSVTDWAVLGALATCASHGFAAARALAPEGSIGQVWTVSRPLVYRAVAALTAAGLVEETGTAPGSAGPRRRLLEVTTPGRVALGAWLVTPVQHVRDYRSELMLKLLLLEGDPRSRAKLLAAQCEELEPICAGLGRRLDAASGFEAVLARWRLDSALAARNFLEALRSSQSGESDG
jgi:DNA-binding PadR family transcriptional regulator